MMGPDIAKGANTQVTAQTCHQDGGNQVKDFLIFFESIGDFLDLSLYNGK